MIAKAIEGSITKTYLKKLRLHIREYEWIDSVSIISNYGSAMIYLIFKIIKPGTRIGVSNLKDDIEKSTLSKFGSNKKYLLDDMS